MRRPYNIAMSRFLVFGVTTLLLILILLYIIFEVQKSSPEFCVSCHLTPSQKLHQAKYDGFMASPPGNMAGLHRKEIPCAGCHEGQAWRQKAVQLGKEGWNTLRYFLGSFQEPRELSPPLLDHGCKKCHASLKAREVFHRAEAHWGQKFPTRCTECHLSHKKGGKKEKYFLPREDLRRQCLRCHPDYPVMEEYLKGF